MFNTFRQSQHQIYLDARNHFIENYEQLIDLEDYVLGEVLNAVRRNIQQISRDYNEASYLYPFWQNYPPEERGRQPIGDQYPWIEVGEHSIGDKLPRLLTGRFRVCDTGLPTGPDVRLIICSNDILSITHGLTDSCWLFLDIKSVGPRDDQDHAVMSHNQIAGSGRWDILSEGIINDVIIATGQRTSHEFHCSIPPIYVLSNRSIVPVVIVILKPVYKMLSLEDNNDGGQPLSRISFASVPNGLLLHEKPGYLSSFQGLFFPGKDDKNTNPQKKRCRVSFEVLRRIAPWRFQEINID